MLCYVIIFYVNYMNIDMQISFRQSSETLLDV